MIYPDVSVEEWMERYPELVDMIAVDWQLAYCSKCGEKNTPEVPFIKRGWIGFVNEECSGCGGLFLFSIGVESD